MKVVILAGGFGTRLAEETETKPKPMVEIGGWPIIWHIMKIYSHYGFNDFIVCLGYKGYLIKEFFRNYLVHRSDLTIDLETNSLTVYNKAADSWRVTLVETGSDTMTGGRIKRIQGYLNNEAFMLTYGDGVADVDINRLVSFHSQSGKMATVTAVQPPGKFGLIHFKDNDLVESFQEKPQGSGSWVNAGFFVCQPGVFNYISGDQAIWEREPLEKLASDNQLVAYRHHGFWRPMDILKDKIELNDLWNSNKASWKVWH